MSKLTCKFPIKLLYPLVGGSSTVRLAQSENRPSKLFSVLVISLTPLPHPKM